MQEHERNQRFGTGPGEDANPPQAQRKHPDEWADDLNPNRLAGQNIGIPEDLPSAYDFKDLHSALSGFESDELRSIPVVPAGERLRQGATYLDLRDRDRREFTATGEMQASADACFVPKSDVPYPLWNRLKGIEDPERTT